MSVFERGPYEEIELLRRELDVRLGRRRPSPVDARVRTSAEASRVGSVQDRPLATTPR